MTNNPQEVSSPTLPRGPAMGHFRVHQLEESFLKHLESKGRSDNTLKNYRTDLECFNQYLDRQGYPTYMDDLASEHIMEYGHYLDERYKSDNSRRRRVQSLRMFFDFLIEKNIYSQNPVRAIPTYPKFLDIPRPTPFSDIKTLWQHLLEESHSSAQMTRLIAKRNSIALVLIYGAGLRVSSLSTLKAGHIQQTDSGSSVMLSPPKRDPYTIPLPQIFIPLYQDYQIELDAAKESAGISFDDVFFNANPYCVLSGGLSPRGLELVFEELRKKLTITLTPKSLRQACIFKWLQQDIPDETIKEWLGVAPSYQLSPYKSILQANVYDDSFLGEMFYHYNKKNYPRH